MRAWLDDMDEQKKESPIPLILGLQILWGTKNRDTWMFLIKCTPIASVLVFFLSFDYHVKREENTWIRITQITMRC